MRKRSIKIVFDAGAGPCVLFPDPLDHVADVAGQLAHVRMVADLRHQVVGHRGIERRASPAVLFHVFIIKKALPAKVDHGVVDDVAAFAADDFAAFPGHEKLLFSAVWAGLGISCHGVVLVVSLAK